MAHRILLADDSLTIQKVVELTFSDAGYELRVVGSGDKAVEALGDFTPDIVLADVVMPGLSGYEVCEAVKRRPDGAFIPVILLTGTFEPFDRARAERAGADSIVTKPFDSHALASLVADLVSKAETARANAPKVEAAAPPPPSAPAAEPEPVAPMAPPVAPPIEPVRPPEPELDMYATSTFRLPSPEAIAREAKEVEAKKEEVVEVPPPAPEAAPEPPAVAATAAASTMEVETDDLFGSEPPPPVAASQPELDMDPDTLVLGEERRTAPTEAASAAAEDLEAPAFASADSFSVAKAAEPDIPPPVEPMKPPPPLRVETAERRYESFSEPPIVEVPPLPEDSMMEESEPVDEMPAAGQVFEMPSEPPPPPPLTSPPTPEDDEVLVRRDLDEDMDQFERSGKATSRPEVWERYEADARTPAPEEPELEALAARASLTELIPGAAPAAASAPSHGPLSDEDVDRIAKRIVELLGDRVVRDVAWEVVPEMAERLVRSRIEELEKA